MATIAANLDRMVAKGAITQDDKAKTTTNINLAPTLKMVLLADLVVEAAEQWN
jgi:3-hydroxybutyryl-CoA dehydrogenase